MFKSTLNLLLKEKEDATFAIALSNGLGCEAGGGAVEVEGVEAAVVVDAVC